MTFSIAKGQYVARDSVVHRLDTRVKVVACLAYAVALFALPGWGGLAAWRARCSRSPIGGSPAVDARAAQRSSPWRSCWC